MTALDAKVSQFVRKGYTVQFQTDTAAQLLKPKKFSFLWAFVWFCCFGVGLLVYLIYYWAKRDHVVYLTTTTTTKRRGNSRWWSLAVFVLLALAFLCFFMVII